MQRRNFISTAAASLPLLALGQHQDSTPGKPKSSFVVKARQSRFNETTMLFGGTSPNDLKVSGQDTRNQLSLFEYTGNVKGGPPLHVHANQDETFFIVSGVYLFKVGTETYELTAGDTIFLPRKVPHCFAQVSETGRMLFMFNPSGKMESFFQKLGAFKQAPTPEAGAALFEAHGMKIVGPPLSF